MKVVTSSNKKKNINAIKLGRKIEQKRKKIEE